jgi:eukaryotic-like serine/threonine-protein kinase
MALEPAKLSDFAMAGALGTGTTAKVWEAVHKGSGRPVAIKVMEQSSSGGEMRERFAREALLLADVESRHVGKILGFGFEKGQPFLVLERLQGETLDAKLRRDGPVAPPIAVRWIEQLIVGVRDCHDAKVIHRDIKPSNIFLHHDGFDETVKLIDFGVARLREITGELGGLTSTHHLIGSMGYMAPEQFKNAKSVGYQADLYAVGVVIYRTLTGRLPFVSRSLDAIIRMKTEQSPPAISSMAGVIQNPLLDWFVQRAMMREPEGRFQSAREMLEQWWNVMASLDEEGTTDIMRGIGRVDESYAGPLHHRPASRPEPDDAHPANDDERTIRKQPVPLPSGRSFGRDPSARPPPEAPAPAVPFGATGSQTAMTTVNPRPPSDRTVAEEASPATLPSHEPAAAPLPPFHSDETETEARVDLTDAHLDTVTDEMLQQNDPFDLPTRNDPGLRKLVERELELQKARKQRGK